MDRAQRYRRRNGGAAGGDDGNPLPKLIDPITLEPVVTPAISPFGHVMGLATWKARPARLRCAPPPEPVRGSLAPVQART